MPPIKIAVCKICYGYLCANLNTRIRDNREVARRCLVAVRSSADIADGGFAGVELEEFVQQFKMAVDAFAQSNPRLGGVVRSFRCLGSLSWLCRMNLRASERGSAAAPST
jgi:hypothetical protein